MKHVPERLILAFAPTVAALALAKLEVHSPDFAWMTYGFPFAQIIVGIVVSIVLLTLMARSGVFK